MNDKPWKQIIDDLTERARELNCLYQIEELLSHTDTPLDGLLQQIVEIIPTGWQYSPLCRAQLSLQGRTFETEGFKQSRCCQSAAIPDEGEEIGRIVVCYAEEVGSAGDREPFLPEEQKLLNTIADRLGHYLFQRKLKAVERCPKAARCSDKKTVADRDRAAGEERHQAPVQDHPQDVELSLLDRDR